jgi:hypothetical protein
MNFDLHMNGDSIEPITEAGKAYLRSVLLRGPVFPERDYLEATSRGLHVSFENRDTLERVTDPGSTSFIPIDINPNAPGYDDLLPEDNLPMDADPRNCDEDDSSWCPDEDKQ